MEQLPGVDAGQESRSSTPINISVVIPCLNGASTLKTQLDALLSQLTEAVFEVVVADNGSTDESRGLVDGIAASDDRLRLVDASHGKGINVARNAGVAAARGSFILLCDVDDEVPQGWMQAYFVAFKEGIGCVGGGADYTLPDGKVLHRIRELSIDSNHPSAPYPIGANCGFSRKVFDAVGGFDEKISGGGDEVDFFWRAASKGYRAQYIEGTTIRYSSRATLLGTFRQFRSYGIGRTELNAKHGYPSPRVLDLRSLLSTARASLIIVLPPYGRRLQKYRATQLIGWRIGILLGRQRLRVRGRRRETST